MKYINQFYSWFIRLTFNKKVALIGLILTAIGILISLYTAFSPGATNLVQSPNVQQIGDNSKSEIIYNNNFIKGVDPRDIEINLSKLKTKTKQERLQEVEEWYTKKEIDLNMKDTLSIVIDHIDKDLQTSQQEIAKLRAEGKDQLATVLERIDEAFADSDIDKMLRIKDEEMNKIQKAQMDGAKISINVADKLAAIFRFKESEENYKKAIELQKSAGMTESSDYAASLNNLAGLYDAQGKYPQGRTALPGSVEDK